MVDTRDIVERLMAWRDRYGVDIAGPETPDMCEEAAAEIALLREERPEVPVVGEIDEMKLCSKLGVYYGTIRCPKCDCMVMVSPMADRPRCQCGIRWDFSVSAVGELPGPEADA